MTAIDFDLLVVGNETEACLAAVAGGRAGARVGLLLAPGAMLGGLLTEDGLAFVDRDARHLVPPTPAAQDGLFGEFLERAGVGLVSLGAERGAAALAGMLAEARVEKVDGVAASVRHQGGRLQALTLQDGRVLASEYFIDATPDGDLAELAGATFATAFAEVGRDGALGVSPLPLVHHVTPAEIVRTCERLAAEPMLEALRLKLFGARAFLDLDHGADYVLVGPPFLGLAYQRWRDARGLGGPHRFEADGFNVAIVGPTSTSWNGLMYFVDDPAERLRLSREGADDGFRQEARHFERFCREELGWTAAVVELPRGVYVRQTRHVLGTRHRLTLLEMAGGYDVRSVGSFCYYPDFRGFHTPKVPGPLTAHVVLDAGLFGEFPNLGIASRAGGYTPFAHSVCRLVQYNVTLGAALAVAAALGRGQDLAEVPLAAIRRELERQGALSDDPSGFERNPAIELALLADPLIAGESLANAS